GRLLDGQIGRLGAFEDSPDVTADLGKNSDVVNSIADQAAGLGPLAVCIDYWNGMARCQGHQLVAPAADERIAGDDEPAGMQFDEGREGGIDLAFGAGLQDVEPYPLRARCFLHIWDQGRGSRAVRVYQ